MRDLEGAPAGYGSPPGKRVRGKSRPAFESPTFRMTSIRQAKKKMDRWERYYYRTTKPLVGFGCSPGDLRAYDRWVGARQAAARNRGLDWIPSIEDLGGEPVRWG